MTDTPHDDQTNESPREVGVLRSIAVACAPDTRTARTLLQRAAALDVAVSDGERWTSFGSPQVSLALAGPSEVPRGASVSLNVKVTDVDRAYADLVADGAPRCAEPADGPHERRASVWLTDSVVLTVYRGR